MMTNKVSRWFGAMCQVGVLAFSCTVYADDLDRAQPFRTEVNGAIDVLKAARSPPSAACSAALDEMHTTDQQLQDLGTQLENDGNEEPRALEDQRGDIAVARDVLATDLQVAASSCQPDVEKACAAASSTAMAKLCDAFLHDMDAVIRTARR